MLRSTRFLVSVATMLALAAPAAHARPAVDPPVATAPDRVVVAAPAPAPTDDGFDWGSAAVGAGGVAGLVVLAGLGSAIAGRARTPATR